ncbi:hypothetical protein N9A28_04530 [Sulfurimonas sp.]|nr:hypothetical protein [Sulfurimonas sp.]
MTEKEIFDFYDENWNDYDKIMDLLHQVLDKHTEDIRVLQNKINNNKNNEVSELKRMLQECQDRLDEETHREGVR